ncbi:T9SS type A sorting domain-containing protein, partial [bacterium]|nr:T9SS type A sorting domain-containing protein [bacterium]
EVVPEDSPSDTTRSMRPTVQMLDGDLMVAFTRETGPWNFGSHTREVWFREGQILPDTAVTDSLSGAVFLDGDFVIPSGVTVTLGPGTIVSVTPTDRLAAGADTTRPEIIVLDGGKLVAAGTEALPVVIQSTVPDSSFTPDVDDWFGFRMLTLASAQNGYGFLACNSTGCEFCSGCDDEKSEFKNVVISGATRGISIEGNVAPEISNATFDIASERDIYLTRDVVLPVDFEWNLKAPTHVVAADIPDSTVQDHSYGTDEKIDFLAEGLTKTFSDNPGTDWVYFEPEAPDGGTAEEWGGVFLNWGRSGHVIEDADFSYAENPLYVNWAGWDSTTTIRRCAIHDFADVGLWLHRSIGAGLAALVESCSVYRGEDLADSLGRVGVYVDGADEATITGNDVTMESNTNGAPSASYSRGIEAYFGKSVCDETPGYSRTLSITENRVEGPGEGEDPAAGGTSGVLLVDICGGNNRTVNVLENWISDFNYAGLEIDEGDDIQVSCNRIETNPLAVWLRRDYTDTTGSGVRFRKNYLKADTTGAGIVRSNDADVTGLGGTDPRGDNELWTYGADDHWPRFVLEDEPGSTHVALPATRNSWFKDGSRLRFSNYIDVRPDLIWTTLLPDSLAGTGDPDEPRIDVTSPYSMTSPSGCWPGSQGRLAGSPGSGVDDEVGDIEATSASLAVPNVTRIGRPFPNPARDTFSFQLDVAPDHAGRYRVVLYDVAGRVVADLEDRVVPAGRYRLQWPVRSGHMSSVSPGIYFLRVTGPGVEKNSKVVVVR